MRGIRLRHLLIIVAALLAGGLILQILIDSRTVNGFTSFTGKSEIVTLTLPPTEQQYGWVLAGAYICYVPGERRPISNLLLQGDENKRRLCRGPHGETGRDFLGLSGEVSLTLKTLTTIEVSVVDAPHMVEASEFPMGKAASHILTIRTADQVDGEKCGGASNGMPIISTGTEKIELWDDAEIHIPINEKTLMPFSGKVMVGQPVSANTPQQFRSGAVAVYRNISRPFYADFLSFGTGGPQLVSETSLFPGDVIKFQDHEAKCFAGTSGFLKAQEGGDGSFIEVVASMHSTDGKVVVSRDTPGSGGSPNQIGIELQFGDAVVNHPFAVWLGLLISVSVLVKEAADVWQSGGRATCHREVRQDDLPPTACTPTPTPTYETSDTLTRMGPAPLTSEHIPGKTHLEH